MHDYRIIIYIASLMISKINKKKMSAFVSYLKKKGLRNTG